MKTQSIILILFVLVAITGCSQQEVNTKWSVTTAKSFISKIPDSDSIHWKGQSNHFSWQAGYIMFAMENMWKATGDSTYFNYIKKYVDNQVDDAGNVADFKNEDLDNFLPGYAILFMYEQTKQEKYKIAAKHIRAGFNDYPRAGNGLFMHTARDWGKNQVWVDGLFMGQIFLARYGKTIGDSTKAFDEVVNQMSLIVSKCQKENGLLLHGWSEDKLAKWADINTGLAPEVWSEGLGWFAVLIADVFDYLPHNQPGRDSLLIALKKLCYGLKDAQDSKTGMWCQVVDKCNEPGNWNETSGTGMFIYLLKKSIENGFVTESEFEPIVEKAYNGMIKKAVKNNQGFIDLFDCSSIGIKKSYAEYISQPKEVSTFAAYGSFIIGSAAIEF